MSENRPLPDNNEPEYTPSQAEGYPKEPLDPNWTTPGKAEGERDSTLDDTQPGRMARERESSSGGLWERVKALIGLGRK
jgi:hypothetical protein